MQKFKDNSQIDQFHNFSDCQNDNDNMRLFTIIIYNMFDSIATLFSTPIIARSYQPKPSLVENCKRTSIIRYGKVKHSLDKQSEDVIESLSKPIETWIIQKEPHLRCAALNQTIYQIIATNSQRRSIHMSGDKTATIHNLFVLIVQYKILNERIKEMNTSQLEFMIDGLCGIYQKEEKGPLDELTCLLHFIISNSKLHQCENLKGNLSLFRPLELHLGKINHFFKTYTSFPSQIKTSFIDIAVNIIPMMTQLCKAIVKTDRSSSKLFLLQTIQWLSTIGIVIMNTIRRDVEAVVASEQETNEEIVNPLLRKRLFDKGNQLIEIEGIITSKVLFSFAYKELYYFQHTLKLHKYMMEIAVQSETYAAEQQRNNLKLVNILLKAVSAYQFNLPDTSIQSIGHILNVSLFQNQNENDLYLPSLKSPQLQEFIEDLKCSPLYQLNHDANDFFESQQEQFEFYLQKDDSIVSSILEMIFNLKLEYLQLLKIIMEKTNKNYLQNFQFYLIKNGLLHFLIEELQSIQSSDKKSLQNYFKVLAMLLHRNTIAYCILNQIIFREIQQNQKSALVEYIRKNFVHSKEFLLIVLSDTVSINSKKTTSKYFLPLSIESLLYSNIKVQNMTKHDIWISYIHDVVLRELKIKRQKQKSKKAYFDEEINEWVMLAIILQIEYMLFKKGSDIQLGQFTMTYLTNMLKQAIKWKYEDETSVMRKLLKSYEQWEIYYTEAIIETQNNEDIIESRWGPTISFLFLRKWNKKICNSIKIFIESVTNCKNVDIF